MASWLPEVWSGLPTITYRSNTVVVPTLDHRWEPGMGVGRGDTVNIPSFSQNNSPRNRGAGTGTFGTGASITFDAATESQTQLVVNRFYYKAHRYPLELSVQALPQYFNLVLEGQGQAIGLQVDADIFADGTSGFDAASTVVGTDNVDITEDDLYTVQTNLNNQNAPVTDRYLVVSPASAASLGKIESLRNTLYRPAVGGIDGARAAGDIGMALTFRVLMSNNLESGTSGKKNYGYHTEAIAYAEQAKLQTEMTTNLEDGGFRQFMTWQTCGFVVVKNAFANEVDGK